MQRRTKKRRHSCPTSRTVRQYTERWRSPAIQQPFQRSTEHDPASDNNGRSINSPSDNDTRRASHPNVDIPTPTTDDSGYTEATAFFIQTAIDQSRRAITTTNNLVEFIKYNVNDMLWWMKLYRIIFIIKEIINIIKLIYSIIL